MPYVGKIYEEEFDDMFIIRAVHKGSIFSKFVHHKSTEETWIYCKTYFEYILRIYTLISLWSICWINNKQSLNCKTILIEPIFRLGLPHGMNTLPIHRLFLNQLHVSV